MGLAASQARYLALTARKSDLEFQSQTINSRRIQLSYKTAQIATEYSEGMNNTTLQISSKDKDNNTIWNKAEYGNIFNATTQTGYMVIGINGGTLDPSPYIKDGDPTVQKVYKAKSDTSSTTYNATEYSNLTTNKKADGTELTDAEKKNTDGTEATTTDLQKAFVATEASTEETPQYKLNSSLTEAEYNKLSAYMKTFFEEDTTQTSSVQKWKVNPDYEAGGGPDLETLLTSASAQIVTKGFFDYLYNNYGYRYDKGMSLTDYQKALQEWNNKEGGINAAGDPAVVDWQADQNNKFQQRSYTEDDDAVLAKYTAETAKVQAQDKLLEIQEKNIETQHKAIETELESIQKVIQNNIEKTFKIFS